MYSNPYKTGVSPYGGYGIPNYGPAPTAVQPTVQQMMQPNAPTGGTISPLSVPSASPMGAPGTMGQLPLEQSYIENILRLNLGKIGTFYMTYENNSQWNAKIFKGRIEAAGRDHIIISDPQTGMRYLLLMVNLDYVTFDEELQYTYPYATPGTSVR
ncbi:MULTISPECIES: spore coat protein GerQ [unclassified Paenibacillus]|uniref:spore coat protein GerQ n=1 Tax=unclassified Paenibacillus TaxID=185978 RepID=UPI001AE7E912|nr:MULTISPECIES: spore coat protein GerQ [unclassified Paenibacillus]MBP1154328.1 spore germination protein Q [Paenibacillus sp. PvP091]MBP1170288.1 spore germination protein Q [Paenibacillus sp. PvR098]MBP2441316.1 spore germination protein Q [Paenibacillus sp. PvP052]